MNMNTNCLLYNTVLCGVQGLAGVVNQADVAEMVGAQKQMLQVGSTTVLRVYSTVHYPEV